MWLLKHCDPIKCPELTLVVTIMGKEQAWAEDLRVYRVQSSQGVVSSQGPVSERSHFGFWGGSWYKGQSSQAVDRSTAEKQQATVWNAAQMWELFTQTGT